MEKKIDFYKMKRELHYKMVDAITSLLKTHGLTVFDLLESDADHAFIIVSPDGAESTQEIEVQKVFQKVFLKEGSLFATSLDEGWLDKDIYLGSPSSVVYCSLADLYETLYDYLEYNH